MSTASVAIGQNFGSVSALWSHFEEATRQNYSAKDAAHDTDETARVVVNPNSESLPDGVAPGGGEVRASFQPA